MKYLIGGASADDVHDALSGAQHTINHLCESGYTPCGGLVLFKDDQNKWHALQPVYNPQVVVPPAPQVPGILHG